MYAVECCKCFPCYMLATHVFLWGVDLAGVIDTGSYDLARVPRRVHRIAGN